MTKKEDPRPLAGGAGAVGSCDQADRQVGPNLTPKRRRKKAPLHVLDMRAAVANAYSRYQASYGELDPERQQALADLARFGLTFDEAYRLLRRRP
jgi:hypothetical protein